MTIFKFAHWPKLSDSGALLPLPSAFIRRNIGDSFSLSRM